MPDTALRRRFDNDGSVCPLPALAPDRTAHYRDHYFALYASHKTRIDASTH